MSTREKFPAVMLPNIDLIRIKIAFRRKFLHLICRKGSCLDYPSVGNDDDFEEGLRSSAEFFRRYEDQINLRGKTVLDMGCGLGSTCFYMVLKGAVKAIGVDINCERLSYAQSKIAEYPSLKDKIEFKLLEKLDDTQFDIVLSKDSFEHYKDPENFISVLKEHVKPDGIIVIGFSPLWKSPYGGHTKYLSEWPWIHFFFPEPDIMAELRRYYNDEQIQSYETFATGLNRMTFRRYIHIIQESNLKPTYLAINVSSGMKARCVMLFFKAIRLIPGLTEYFTINVYSILRLR